MSSLGGDQTVGRELHAAVFTNRLNTENLQREEPVPNHLRAPYAGLIFTKFHVARNGGIVHECWTGKDLKESTSSLTELLPLNFPEGTEENIDKLQSW
jgi:hypothetical protein